MPALQDHRLSLGDLRLTSGVLIEDVQVAYAHYGQLATGGRNAILVGHGYTANHHMLAHGEGVAEGSWASLIGPGMPLDTNRFFIVCSNMLGSCYGTTGPNSLNPHTGQPYGGDFPEITMSDIVAVQHRLLQELGVRHLRAVIGPSFGGFQALQWAIDHPGMVDAIGVVLSAPWLPRNVHTSMDALLAQLSTSPHWRYGHCDISNGMEDALYALRLDAMQNYGAPQVYAARGGSPQTYAEFAQAAARSWAKEFDAHSLVRLLEAAQRFDARPYLRHLQVHVLQVLSDTDLLFPADETCLMPCTGNQHNMSIIRMRTDYGHMASGAAASQWCDGLRWLLNQPVH